jgi:acyl-CoA reductase-like NAD-dependent aldehyde dehydrogenase
MITFDDLKQLFPEAEHVPVQACMPAPIHQRVSLVDGELCPWEGPNKTVLSPVCVRTAAGEVEQVEIGSYPVMGEPQSEAALNAAVRAYDHGRGVWPTMTVAQRIECMEDFIRQMAARRKEIVNLITWEIGKSAADSAKEFDRTITYMVQTIDALKELDNGNSRFVIHEHTIGQIRRTPLGVVLCMGPYNYPLNETFATLIPALLMGNTVVFKPPQYGTLLFEPLLEAFRTAFPKGVINTIYAPGAVVVPHMLASGKIDVLALIGSSKVADHLKKQHPKSHRLRAILGLDAKNAAIVLPDADLDLTVKECLLGALSFNGQRCTALKMLLVHRSIVEPFIKHFVEELGKLKVGMPWDAGVNITPLPGMHRTAYMTAAIDDAKALGASVVNEGGGTFCKTLFYPAVVYPVSEGMMLYREEQFGPLIPIAPFDELQ